MNDDELDQWLYAHNEILHARITATLDVEACYHDTLARAAIAQQDGQVTPAATPNDQLGGAGERWTATDVDRWPCSRIRHGCIYGNKCQQHGFGWGISRSPDGVVDGVGEQLSARGYGGFKAGQDNQETCFGP